MIQDQTTEKPGRPRTPFKAFMASLSLLLGGFGVVSVLAIAWARGREGFDIRAQLLGISLLLVLGAVVTGHLGRFRPGYWCGYAWVVLMIGLVFAHPMPRSYISTQALAVGSLRTLNTSEITYASTYNIGFSPTLSCLGPGRGSTGPSATAAGLIDDVLAGTGNSSEKSGYRFVYAPGLRDAKERINSYSITASPTQPGVTGTNYYYTDQTGVIRQNNTAPATVADSPIVG